jgi:serine/threonine protein kinase
MALTSGTRLGPYEILAAIGAGGMGEVYRGRDTRLDRTVAIKVLPDAVARDAERLARFEREAKTLAVLNHTNIAQIYGLEQGALAMEFVEGEDLSVKITRGPIPIDDALEIAKQIADALESAHELGVVHRDLKSSNIRVRDDGIVKVLDFGLAKALAPAVERLSGTAGSTVTTPAMTGLGTILGTAAYMAPEQAKGRGKWPAWVWTRSFGAWPASAEWLSAMFDYNVAPFFQSFVVVTVDPAARRLTFRPWGINGPLTWKDLDRSTPVTPPDVPPDREIAWIVSYPAAVRY